MPKIKIKNGGMNFDSGRIRYIYGVPFEVFRKNAYGEVDGEVYDRIVAKYGKAVTIIGEVQVVDTEPQPATEDETAPEVELTEEPMPEIAVSGVMSNPHISDYDEYIFDGVIINNVNEKYKQLAQDDKYKPEVPQSVLESENCPDAEYYYFKRDMMIVAMPYMTLRSVFLKLVDSGDVEYGGLRNKTTKDDCLEAMRTKAIPLGQLVEALR